MAHRVCFGRSLVSLLVAVVVVVARVVTVGSAVVISHTTIASV